MEFIVALWLPILIITVVLFFASFAAWMLLPHHFSDKQKLEKEQEFMNLINDLKIPAGNYMFPYAQSKQDQGSKEFQQRYMDGPRGCLDVYDVPNMGLNMGKTVVFFLVTTAIIGYVTYFVFQIAGADNATFINVFRVAGTIGILTHASSGALNSVWFKRRQWTDSVDGVVYGLLIGLIFAAMWPAGS
jgi:hypothetical protein